MIKNTLAASVMALTFNLCANHDHLVFTTFTKAGLDVSATNATPTSAMFGYKRFEGAIIPVNPDLAEGKPSDAHSVFATINLDNRWLGGLDLFQVFATGDAAVNAAGNPQGLLEGFGIRPAVSESNATTGAGSNGGTNGE